MDRGLREIIKAPFFGAYLSARVCARARIPFISTKIILYTRAHTHTHTHIRSHVYTNPFVRHRCRPSTGPLSSFGHWLLYIIQYIIISTRVFSTTHLPSLAGRANNSITRFRFPSRSLRSLSPSVSLSRAPTTFPFFSIHRIRNDRATAVGYNNIIIHIYYYEQRCAPPRPASDGDDGATIMNGLLRVFGDRFASIPIGIQHSPFTFVWQLTQIDASSVHGDIIMVYNKRARNYILLDRNVPTPRAG